jgi:hypothetical protein
VSGNGLGRRNGPLGGEAAASNRCSERQLWCAVIGRALEDAVGNPGGAAGAVARHRAIEESRRWFLSNDPDFRLVCDAAGYDPDVLRHRVLRLLANGSSPPSSLLPGAGAPVARQGR